MSLPGKLIKEVESAESLLKHGDTFLNLTIQSLDLNKINIDWQKVKLANTTFLGCDMSEDLEILLRRKGAMIYPKVVGLPYNPYRRKLYTWRELMEGYDAGNNNSTDLKIYTHFNTLRYSADINEALSQRIHDHAIDDALREVVGFDESGMTGRKCLGIMGGHGVLRTDPLFRQVAIIAKKLAESGYFILSGGGPGVMEAANMGAYFAGKAEADLDKAIDILKVAPDFKDATYIEQGRKVIDMYPDGTENMAVPTWFYGHEPSNFFAQYIAKYFSNSIREDVLLATSLYGIIYAPGSAGTVQEIFADAAQNYYETYGYTSPMVFLGKKFWSEDNLVYQMLSKFSEGKKFHEMIDIFDDSDEIVDFIKGHPPIKLK